MQVETVKVVHEGKRGFKNINESDFKKGTHEVYSEKPKKTPKEALIDKAQALGVDKTGMASRQLKEAIKEAKDDNN